MFYLSQLKISTIWFEIERRRSSTISSRSVSVSVYCSLKDLISFVILIRFIFILVAYTHHCIANLTWNVSLSSSYQSALSSASFNYKNRSNFSSSWTKKLASSLSLNFISAIIYAEARIFSNLSNSFYLLSLISCFNLAINNWQSFTTS